MTSSIQINVNELEVNQSIKEFINQSIRTGMTGKVRYVYETDGDMFSVLFKFQGGVIKDFLGERYKVEEVIKSLGLETYLKPEINTLLFRVNVPEGKTSLDHYNKLNSVLHSDGSLLVYYKVDVDHAPFTASHLTNKFISDSHVRFRVKEFMYNEATSEIYVECAPLNIIAPELVANIKKCTVHLSF